MKRTQTDYRGHVLGKCSECGKTSITYVCDRCYLKDYKGGGDDLEYRANPLYSPDDRPEEKKVELPWRSPLTPHRQNGIPLLPRDEPPETL